jgi:hypothetical protein
MAENEKFGVAIQKFINSSGGTMRDVHIYLQGRVFIAVFETLRILSEMGSL